jgi:16S rRNA (adenine1518-N6/adenine1519-N6)-dimethyltransferase
VKLYRPSDLHAYLNEKGVAPKKRLSQNFLIDGNIIAKILHTAQIQPDDLVIEIGPGPGALTQALLAQGARVIAIEKDRALAADLERLQTPDERLTVLCQDALTLSYPSLLKGKQAKVVANLPYQITTPLLITLLPLYPTLTSLTVMVQKEFADRLRASPKTADYGSITLFMNFYGAITHHFVVSPHCFYPKPKVHSTVIHCQLKSACLAEDAERFFVLTRSAFQQRRKMLKVSLRHLYSITQIEEGLEQLKLPPTSRPEELSLEQFLALYRFLKAM